MFESFKSDSPEFLVRPAAAIDAKALRMILPQLRDVAAAYVAVDGEHGLVIGAAASTRSTRMQPLLGPGVAVHVIEPCRRRGIATKLLGQLESAVQKLGARAMYAAARVEQNSDEYRLWKMLGFEPCETVEEHLLPVDQISARLVPLVERMRAAGRIPENARVVPLYQADPTAVLQLHLAHMGGDRNDLARKLREQGTGAFLPRQSRVLYVGDQVKGCLLASRTCKDTIVVDANIVEPSLRGGWANAWLKLEAFQGTPPGVMQFKFTSFDHYADTRSFTERLGGRTIRRTALMMRRITGTSTTTSLEE